MTRAGALICIVRVLCFDPGMADTIDGSGLLFDRIGYWSEIKLDIVREYAHAYSSILSKKRLSHSYIDGFAGSGVHLSRSSQEFVPGSPLNALRVTPPFNEYFLVDLDGDKVEQLQRLPEVANREEVHIIHGDCNKVLLSEVFPLIKYEDYRRALCVLDPYGLHLNWEVIETAGKMRSVEIFLNFPVLDMNRNALWRNPEMVGQDGIRRMTLFWGDESWRSDAYLQQGNLFGPPVDIKGSNRQVVDAFSKRLENVAGFRFVSEPMPMRNSNNAVVYYLLFAAQQPVAAKIVREIMDKYRDRRS